LLNLGGSCKFKDLLSGNSLNTDDIAKGISVKLPPMGGVLLEF